MRIYFSCSITGGRDDQPVYQRLVKALLDDGHSVPTAHLADAETPALEVLIEAEDVYRRDVTWVKESDAMVAEVSTPSHGVGYEIALAELSGKPVFCCYRSGVKVSKMILGNPSPLISSCAYDSAEDAIKNMRVFLNQFLRE